MATELLINSLEDKFAEATLLPAPRTFPSARGQTRRNRLAGLIGTTALVAVSGAFPAFAQSAPGTVISSNTALSGNVSGGGGGGYLVNGGTLTISNGIVSGFVTTGGSGSGGGAGLGGAIMVDTGGTVVLNNVTVQDNGTVGGEGGDGTVGGSLNGLFKPPRRRLEPAAPARSSSARWMFPASPARPV